ncbi:MAG: hypothetical protein NXI24_00120 [bacterium]|nr:hypothetical protein [bacterium]
MRFLNLSIPFDFTGIAFAAVIFSFASLSFGCYAKIERGVYPAAWHTAGVVSTELVRGYADENTLRLAIISGDPPDKEASLFPELETRPAPPEFVLHLRMAGHRVAFVAEPAELKKFAEASDFDLVIHYRKKEQVWTRSGDASTASVLALGLFPLYSDTGTVWELKCGRNLQSLAPIDAPEFHIDRGDGWIPWLNRVWFYENANQTLLGFRRLAQKPEERGLYFQRNLANAIVHMANTGGCAL